MRMDPMEMEVEPQDHEVVARSMVYPTPEEIRSMSTNDLRRLETELSIEYRRLGVMSDFDESDQHRHDIPDHPFLKHVMEMAQKQEKEEKKLNRAPDTLKDTMQRCVSEIRIREQEMMLDHKARELKVAETAVQIDKQNARTRQREVRVQERMATLAEKNGSLDGVFDAVNMGSLMASGNHRVEKLIQVQAHGD